MDKISIVKMEVESFGLKTGLSSADVTLSNCYDGGEDGCDNTCDNDSGCDVY